MNIANPGGGDFTVMVDPNSDEGTAYLVRERKGGPITAISLTSILHHQCPFTLPTMTPPSLPTPAIPPIDRSATSTTLPPLGNIIRRPTTRGRILIRS